MPCRIAAPAARALIDNPSLAINLANHPFKLAKDESLKTFLNFGSAPHGKRRKLRIKGIIKSDSISNNRAVLLAQIPR